LLDISESLERIDQKEKALHPRALSIDLGNVEIEIDRSAV